MKKKLLFLLLTLVSMPTFAADSATEATATSDNTVTYDNLIYTIDNITNTCTVTGMEVETLKVVNIPSFIYVNNERYTVTSISHYAFGDNEYIISVTIPATVTALEGATFIECTNLVNVNILGDITSIGETTFFGCTKLENINIPESVTTIGNGAFANCSSLTSITIPEAVTTISDMAFYGCAGLKSIILPSSVREIGDHAFNYCTSLSSVTILSSNVDFSENIWTDCPNISNIYYYSNKLSEGFENMFPTSVYETATLYVSESNYTDVATTSPWNLFDSNTLHIVASVGNVIVNPENVTTEVYNLNGIKVANTTDGLTNGIYIVRQGSDVRKIAVK